LHALATALAGAVLGDDGRAAQALDEETSNDPPALRAFLQRLPSSTTTLNIARIYAASVERTWLRQALAGRDPQLLAAPLVEENALVALATVHARCQTDAAALALATVQAGLQQLQASPSGARALKKLAAGVNKKRRLPTLRALTEEFWGQGLDALLPVWLCSPESAAALFPPRTALFDLVIFDEASQCPVESALPALVRARRAIIAGDDQQMPPSHFFQANSHDEEADDDDSALLASASVLDLARVVYPSTTLAWHYRSQDERLIAFSNAAFYGGKLTTAPRATRGHDRVEDDGDIGRPGLFFTRVDGRFVRQQNDVEAAAVVDRVVALLSSRTPPSVGVVAFNQPHAERIEELLEKRVADDPSAKAAFAAMQGRPPTERLFVRNLENVQGDERDVIVVSPAYAPGDDGTLAARFGPLGLSGGERRLNVAITRARTALHVVLSFDPAALDVAGTRHDGPKLFRLWLLAVQAAARGDEATWSRVLDEARVRRGGRGDEATHGGGAAARAAANVEGRRVLADRLAARLQAQGLTVVRDVGLGAVRLALGVVAPGGTNVGVDLGFVDDADALARDVYAPSFWQRAGFVVVRVTPFSFFAEDDVVARIVACARRTPRG
jgi:hypothetical protein